MLEMARRGMVIAGAKVLVLGLSFKENCPDLRNTRVVDLTQVLQRYGMEPLVVDPGVDPEQAQSMYKLTVLPAIPSGQCWSAVVVAVAHEHKALTVAQWQQLIVPDGVLLI